MKKHIRKDHAPEEEREEDEEHDEDQDQKDLCDLFANDRDDDDFPVEDNYD